MPTPVEYLLVLSRQSLQEFKLNRLNRAANLRKHAAEIFDEWIKAEAEALHAQWLIEHPQDERAAELQQRTFEFPADFQTALTGPADLTRPAPKRVALPERKIS